MIEPGKGNLDKNYQKVVEIAKKLPIIRE